MPSFRVSRFSLLLSVGALLCTASVALADGTAATTPSATGDSSSAAAPSEKAKTESATLTAVEKAGGEKAGGEKAAGENKKAPTGPMLNDFDLARYQYCGNDNDCGVAINGCCDCENGGVEVAVNKDRIDAFNKRFECEKVACGEVLTSTECGRGVVSCVEHRCKYFIEEAQ